MRLPSLLAVCVLLLPECAAPDAGRATQQASAAADRPNGPCLRGRVVDREGRGLAGITVQPHGGVATRFRCDATRTGADGRFTVDATTCGARVWHDGEAFAYIGLAFEGTSYASVDGRSWWDIEVPLERADATEHVFVLVESRADEPAVPADD